MSWHMLLPDVILNDLMILTQAAPTAVTDTLYLIDLERSAYELTTLCFQVNLDDRFYEPTF